jgi:hypothetical protein
VPDLVAVPASRLTARCPIPGFVTIATIVAVFHINLRLRRRRVLAGVIAVLRLPATARVPAASAAERKRCSNLLLVLSVAVLLISFVVVIAVVRPPRSVRASLSSRARYHTVFTVPIIRLLVILPHQWLQVLAEKSR